VFIRENKNRSGSISVQVVQKVNGRNKVAFSAGSATAPHGVELLKIKARGFIEKRNIDSSLADMGALSMRGKFIII
jgi:hypothetical protein